jgi:hypothetical protein
LNPRKQRRFLVGAVLAWVPFAVLTSVVKGATEPHLAGIVAWGGKSLLLSAIVLGMAAEAASIPLLLGGFARGKWARGVFSVLSLCCAAFMSLLFMVLLVVVWLGISQLRG